MATRILIIDDERDLCHLLKMVLLRDRFLVDCAFNLLSATRKLILHPRIIFLDNNLPDGSGIDYFHDHPEMFTQSTVVLITADDSPLMKTKALEKGIQNFIQKPFSIKEIKDIIKKNCQETDSV